MLFLVAIIFIIATWKWGDWRNWKWYYPTILFLILGDFIYLYFTCNYPLWRNESPWVNQAIADFVWALIIFPCTILLLIPHYPSSGIIRRISYILMWVLIYIVMEWLIERFGSFSYHNGWSFWWSVWFDCTMLPLLLLHHRKPLLALIMAAVFGGVILIIFEVPFK